MTSTPLVLQDQAPDFRLAGVCSGKERDYSLSDLNKSWLVLFFYPADFTFVCPTEIRGFEKERAAFEKAGAQIAALSVDDLSSHRAWAEELGGVSFPLLSDPEGRVASLYGVLNPADGMAHRATFVINPQGRADYCVVSPANVGRSVSETLRVVLALQTGRLCPADWRPGDPPLSQTEGY